MDKKKIRQLLAVANNKDLTEDEQEFLIHALMVKFNRVPDLSTLLDAASDRLSYNKKITDAVKLVKGQSFGFSGHGIRSTISGKFSEEQQATIVRKLHGFSILLKEKLDIQSFVTSGTLLGLVRENQFLKHDDDFDMAYISCFTKEEDILAERQRLFDAINTSEEYQIKERTGGRAAVFVRSDEVNFNFDLFAGYQHGKYFNEFPLQPEAVNFAAISPVRVTQFYGEDVFVPKKPEKLLEVNYGRGWKKPDPSFRFNFRAHRKYYKFLLDNKISDGDPE